MFTLSLELGLVLCRTRSQLYDSRSRPSDSPSVEDEAVGDSCPLSTTALPGREWREDGLGGLTDQRSALLSRPNGRREVRIPAQRVTEARPTAVANLINTSSPDTSPVGRGFPP